MGMVAGAVVLLLLLLLAAAMLHVFLGWPLLVGVALFALCAGRLGRTGREIGKMIADGLGKAWIVVQVLIVIGLLTASWIACGAIPYLVRLGTLLIRPHVFLVCCFWLCAAMSFLLGTSFGTANTVGVVLITIARAGGVSIPMTAGAILCGIYFGDRSSPMSSSLLLLSTLSETRLYDNVRMGLASSAIPFALASGGYLLCSYVSPLSAASGRFRRGRRKLRRQKSPPCRGVSPAPSGAAAHSGGVPPLRCPKAGEVGHGGQHGAGLYSGGDLPGDAASGAGADAGAGFFPA